MIHFRLYSFAYQWEVIYLSLRLSHAYGISFCDPPNSVKESLLFLFYGLKRKIQRHKLYQMAERTVAEPRFKLEAF